MKYYSVRQRKDLRWESTCKEGGRSYPVGYCAGKEAQGHTNHADKYHVDGHETAEEAFECCRQYQLDHFLGFHDGEGERTLRVCDHSDCDEFTSGRATIQCKVIAHLCPKHRTREIVEEIYLNLANSCPSLSPLPFLRLRV
jgi:hypothetical protein